MTRLPAEPLCETNQAVMPITMTAEIQMSRLVAMRMGEILWRPAMPALSRVVPIAILDCCGVGVNVVMNAVMGMLFC